MAAPLLRSAHTAAPPGLIAMHLGDRPAMNDILLVDDDVRLSALISGYLTSHGYTVDTEQDPSAAQAKIVTTHPALVLLDIGLGVSDGLDICRTVRPHYRGILCIFSSRADDIHHVLSLELGADDYITKPIKPRVLLARLRAHLRRATTRAYLPEPTVSSTCGALTIDPIKRQVTCHGEPIMLTTAEFDLLMLLAQHKGQPLDRDTLYRTLRGVSFDGADRSIDARISRLRRKLGDNPDDPALIKTVRGRGYLFPGQGR